VNGLRSEQRVSTPIRVRKELVEKSKFLSLVLRHDPGSIGVALNAEGWVGEDAEGRGGNRFLRCDINCSKPPNLTADYADHADRRDIRAIRAIRGQTDWAGISRWSESGVLRSPLGIS